MSHPLTASRCRFLKHSAAMCGLTSAGISGVLAARSAPAAVINSRPLVEQGLQIGDVLADRAIVWSRTDRPARLLVEWDTTDNFADQRRVAGPHALEVSDFTARADLTGLPGDQDIFVRITFQGLEARGVESEPLIGHFRSAPAPTATFASSGARTPPDKGTASISISVA